MQSFYPEHFEREMGCTEAEWLSWLPRAVGEHAYETAGRHVTVALGAGQLEMRWRVLPPRTIGLIRLPCLLVSFDFSGLDDGARRIFMKRFDLYTQRGGG